MILDTTSLNETIDNINTLFLSGAELAPAEGLEAARWIVSRQGGKGSYRGMPAPTPADFEQGLRVFTGERLFSASARHIMGQEAARAAWLLGHDDAQVRQAYNQATAWMHAAPDYLEQGTFCCRRCSLAFWRHVWVGTFDDKEAHIAKGLQWMKSDRLGDGKWRSFPFFYSIYTLSELDLEAARDELTYARQPMERYVKKIHTDEYSKRKVAIITKVLDNLN